MSAMTLSSKDLRLTGGCAVIGVVAGVLHFAGVNDVVTFIVAALALALLATLVGRSVEALGDQLSPGATGVVQSAFGNLPELFVTLFALHAGLYEVVRSAIVGSILANVLAVLGLAFFIGGLKHGTQRFGTDAAKRLSLMLVLAVAALLVPSLTATLHTPAAGHERVLSIIVAIVLLALFVASLPASIRRESTAATAATGATGATGATAAREGSAREPLEVGHPVGDERLLRRAQHAAERRLGQLVHRRGDAGLPRLRSGHRPVEGDHLVLAEPLPHPRHRQPRRAVGRRDLALGGVERRLVGQLARSVARADLVKEVGRDGPGRQPGRRQRDVVGEPL